MINELTEQGASGNASDGISYKQRETWRDGVRESEREGA